MIFHKYWLKNIKNIQKNIKNKYRKNDTSFEFRNKIAFNNITELHQIFDGRSNVIAIFPV